MKLYKILIQSNKNSIYSKYFQFMYFPISFFIIACSGNI